MSAAWTGCQALESTVPWERTAAQHDEVSDWIRHHASKFFQSLSPSPSFRTHALKDLSSHARLYSLSRGDILCVQNESSDNVYIVYSGAFDIFFNSNSRVRRKQGTVVGRNLCSQSEESPKTSPRSAPPGSELFDEMDMSAADAPSSPSALDHEKDFGSKFATFHTVGDFFGESDVTNDNSVYPFTAIAESAHSLEAEILLNQQANGATEKGARITVTQTMRRKHEELKSNNKPRVIAIPREACDIYLKAVKGEEGSGSSRIFRMWDRVNLLKASHMFKTWSANALYLLAMSSEEKQYTTQPIVQREKKIPPILYFIMEGEVNFCLVDDGNKARTTLMSYSTLSYFGDFGKVARDAEASALEEHFKRESEDMKPQTIRRQTSVKRQASSTYVKPNAFNKKISFKKMGSTRTAGLSPKLNSTRSISMKDTHERSMSMKRGMGDDVNSGRVSPADADSGSGVAKKFISGKFVSTQSKKSPGEIIDQSNSMVKVKKVGSAAPVSLSPTQSSIPGTINEPQEDSVGDSGKERANSTRGVNRLVLSNFLIAPSGGSCRLLAINSDVFSQVSKYISQSNLWMVLDYMTERVKSHSQWLDTQLHLQEREKEKGKANLAVTQMAIGEQLWVKQSSFITCDRCNNLNCYAMKASCARKKDAGMSKAAKSLDAQGIRFKVTNSSKGTGKARLEGLKPNDGGPAEEGEDNRRQRVQRNSLKKDEEEAMLQAAKDARMSQRTTKEPPRRSKRRGSIEVLFNMFKPGGSKSPTNAKGKNNKSKGEGRESSVHEIDRQLTIRKTLKDKRNTGISGANKKGRRSSIGSIKASLSKALGFSMD
ncbi:hypothetical protein TL16_g07882 [Triparma laevis f. inornata]|uniref:Cyclic nucleotide-binding domain-containing protein n=1 Tax=Triparma laevis f. inornata TaxID=1714386 RepID=A0A9W7AUN4_9STRA|nr:hypothetical protein TL16_g07882 [Triparma laevis f. inornata]